MSNKERLLNSPTPQCASELKTAFTSPAADYIDYVEWLDSNDPECLPNGERVRVNMAMGLLGDRCEEDVVIVQRKESFGRKFLMLYVINKKCMVTLPSESVVIMDKEGVL